MCPICSIGVVAGLGLSRWLKVDDSVSGLWVGALLLGLSLWTFNWLMRKREKKPVIILIIVLIAYCLLTFAPLYATNIINNSCKTIWGLNRLVFGSLLGIVLFGAVILINKKLKGLFPYQRIIIPMSVLIIASFILNAVCK
ncbi:MAG: hypothetical protein NTX55_01685 [Candidatus Parcubacteria bacterium]|nr:hypothetical protein [Candidatus Parcubacteria bacterium]